MVSAIASISSLPSQRCTLELHLSFGLGGSSLSWGERVYMASLPLKCSSGLQNSKQQQKFMNQSDIYHLVLFGWELSTLLPVCLKGLFLTFLGFSRRELSSKKLFVSEGNSFCLFHSLLSGGHDAFVSEEEGICLVQ